MEGWCQWSIPTGVEMCGRPVSGYNASTDKKRKEHDDSRQVVKRIAMCLLLPQPVVRWYRATVAETHQGRSPSGFWSGSRSGCNANYPPPPPSPTHNIRSQLKNGTSQSTSHSVLVYSPKNKYAVQVYVYKWY